MSRRPRDGFEENAPAGCTVMFCDACADEESPDLTELRQTIRRMPHGMLVRVHCPLGRMWCRARKASGNGGLALVVQPCTAGRRPLGPAILVGPVRTAHDLVTVARWLDTAPRDTDLLPPHLRGMRHSHRN